VTLSIQSPTPELNADFSSPGATAVPWAEAVARLEAAEVYWVSTVRPEGRPHVAPLIAVWLDDALYFCTGETERKARNLAGNTQVVITTGSNAISDQLDLVVEGEAAVVSDAASLRRAGDAYAAKYGEDWRLPGLDGVVCFEVTPTTAFGFGRGAGDGPPPKGGFSQTRWRFRSARRATTR
jgi:nitroimidazol reductase NimA-like FMN-containing flavoprotein (pyridoxamine 5'-phosphate oxidase superfamily)